MTGLDDSVGRLAAVRARDRAADGAFVYSVATTGVYCRPSCAARPALTENLAFHDTAALAEQAGFRACKRCRPNLPPLARREAVLVAAACRRIEAAETPPALATLAAAAGCSPHHFHRMFRRVSGVTPGAYAAWWRTRRVQAELTEGSSVTQAMYGAGFNSSGRFYAAADAMLGMPAGRYRAGGAGETIHHATGAGALGTVLVAATARGVCAILLGDGPESLEADLAQRFPQASLVPAEAGFAGWVAAVVAHIEEPGGTLDLPLDIRGTVFQRRVWAALQAIPAGETRSYAGLAAALGMPNGARAVAGACAANALAVAVPCHRVVAGSGALAGYRWGLERKQALLTAEGVITIA